MMRRVESQQFPSVLSPVGSVKSKSMGGQKKRPTRFVVTDAPDEPDFSFSPRHGDSSSEWNFNDGFVLQESQTSSNPSGYARPGKTEQKGRFTIIDLAPGSPKSHRVDEVISRSPKPSTMQVNAVLPQQNFSKTRRRSSLPNPTNKIQMTLKSIQQEVFSTKNITLGKVHDQPNFPPPLRFQESHASFVSTVDSIEDQSENTISMVEMDHSASDQLNKWFEKSTACCYNLKEIIVANSALVQELRVFESKFRQKKQEPPPVVETKSIETEQLIVSLQEKITQLQKDKESLQSQLASQIGINSTLQDRVKKLTTEASKPITKIPKQVESPSIEKNLIPISPYNRNDSHEVKETSEEIRNKEMESTRKNLSHSRNTSEELDKMMMSQTLQFMSDHSNASSPSQSMSGLFLTSMDGDVSKNCVRMENHRRSQSISSSLDNLNIFGSLPPQPTPMNYPTSGSMSPMDPLRRNQSMNSLPGHMNYQKPSSLPSYHIPIPNQFHTAIPQTTYSTGNEINRSQSTGFLQQYQMHGFHSTNSMDPFQSLPDPPQLYPSQSTPSMMEFHNQSRRNSYSDYL